MEGNFVRWNKEFQEYSPYCLTPFLLLFLIQTGQKNAMSCTYAQDFIYKGVAILDNDGNKCRLRNAKDVARVILAKACGWNSRNKEVMSELEKKGFFPPFDSLKLESHLLMDDFVESSVVVRKTFSLQAHNSVIEVFFSYENRLAQLSS